MDDTAAHEDLEMVAEDASQAAEPVVAESSDAPAESAEVVETTDDAQAPELSADYDATPEAESFEAVPAVESDTDAVEDAELEPEMDAAVDAEPESEAAADAEPAVEAAPEELSLDELVAELSDEEAAEAAETTEASPEDVTEAAPTEGTESEAAPVTADEEVVAVEPLPVRSRLWTRVPFWLLGLVWVGFIGALTYLLWPASTEPFVTSPLYPTLVFGGAALVAVGFVTGMVVWLVARAKAGHDGRVGLGRTIWMRALGWTAIGVSLWWIALIVLDMHRSGVIR